MLHHPLTPPYHHVLPPINISETSTNKVTQWKNGRPMYTAPKSARERRAPSAAALRVLYQLAYITSGTAVGVGVLCAEERRRRTAIVQRIADNARRIHQSPRYVHNATAGSFASQSDSFEGVYAVEAGRRRRARKSLKDAGTDSAGEQVGLQSGREPLGSEKKNGGWYASFQDTRDSLHDARMSESVDGMNGGNKPSYRLDRRRSVWTGSLFPTRSEISGIPHKARLSNAVLGDDPDIPKPTLTPATTLQTDILDESGKLHQGLAVSPSVRPNQTIQSAERIGPKPLTPEAIRESVDLLIQSSDKVRMAESKPEQTERVGEMASRLLAVACNFGSIEEIQTLVSFKDSIQQLTSEDLKVLYSACSALSARVEHEVLFSFYRNLLLRQSRSMGRSKEFFEAVTDLMSHGTCWELSMGYARRLSLLIPESLNETEFRTLLRCVHSKCREMIAKGHAATAIELFIGSATLKRGSLDFEESTGNENPGAGEDLNALFDALFDDGLRNNRFSDCARLLQLRLDTLGQMGIQDSLRTQLNLVCHAWCASRWGNQAVRFFSSTLPNDNMIANYLDEPNRANLALVCSKNGARAQFFDNLYFSLSSAKYRAKVESDALRTAIYTTYDATRNIQTVENQYLRYLDHLHPEDHKHVRLKLQIAYLECCIRAGKYREAERNFADLHQSAHSSSESIALAALYLAQRKAWVALDKLFHCVRETPLKFNRTTIEPLYTMFSLYVTARGPVVAQQFLINLVDNYGIRLSRIFHNILLRAFVTTQRFEFIPKWIEQSKRIDPGRAVDLDSRLISSLLQRFYLEYRPTASTMFDYCRKLSEKIIDLDCKPLLSILQVALAHDMKEYCGDQREVMEVLMRRRLELVQAAGDSIPYQGYAYRDKVYFERPKTPVAQRTDSAVHLSPSAGSPSAEPLSVENAAAATEALNLGKDDVVNVEEVDVALLHLQDHVGEPVSLEITGHMEPNARHPVTDQTALSPAILDEKLSAIRSHNDSHRDLLQTDKGQQNEKGHGATRTDRDVLKDLSADDLWADDGRRSLDPKMRRDIERKLLTAFSYQQDQKLMEIYQETTQQIGLPASIRCVEIALQSCLRRDVEPISSAYEILAEAQDLGMDISHITAPCFIGQMNLRDHRGKLYLRHVRKLASDYSTLSERLGHKVSPAVWTHAAVTFIKADKAAIGLQILHDHYLSTRAKSQKPSIVTMSAFVFGFSRLKTDKAMEGISWTVNEVLENDIYIDKRFLRQLSKARRGLCGGAGTATSNSNRRLLAPDGPEAKKMTQWTEQCKAKRYADKTQALRSGWRLIDLLIHCKATQQDTESDPHARADIPSHQNKNHIGQTSSGAEMLHKSIKRSEDAHDSGLSFDLAPTSELSANNTMSPPLRTLNSEALDMQDPPQEWRSTRSRKKSIRQIPMNVLFRPL